MSEVYDFYSEMREKKVVLCYKGHISDEFLHSILRLAEYKLERIEFQLKLKKKVFNILVELLQNLYHHVEDLESDDPEYYSVAFLLKKEDSGYRIFTGNHLKNSEAKDLKERLDAINSMEGEELREFYREKLDMGKFTKKGGAGLGILDVVRKSHAKINYEFKQVDNQVAFLSLLVNIDSD